jgi:hypothetical protein
VCDEWDRTFFFCMGCVNLLVCFSAYVFLSSSFSCMCCVVLSIAWVVCRTCEAPSQPEAAFLDWRASVLLKFLNFLDAELLNRFFYAYSLGTGTLAFDGSLLVQKLLDDQAGTLHVGIWDLEIVNVHHFQEFTFLKSRADDPFTTDSRFLFAGPGVANGVTFTVSFGLKYTARATGKVTTNSYRMSVNGADLAVVFSTTVLVDTAEFWSTKLGDVTDKLKVFFIFFNIVRNKKTNIRMGLF